MTTIDVNQRQMAYAPAPSIEPRPGPDARPRPMLTQVPAPAASAPQPPTQVLSTRQGREPWLPNVVDLSGDPTSARSAVRNLPGGRVEISSGDNPISGKGYSMGPQGNAFAGQDLRTGQPQGDLAVNPFELFGYDVQGLGKTSATSLQDALPIDKNMPGAKEAVALLKSMVRPYERTGSEGFASRQFVHASGFYPGDPSAEGRTWQERNRAEGDRTPDLEESRWGGDAEGQSGGYVQSYLTFNPRNRIGTGASRYVMNRIDHTYYTYKSQVVEGNKQATTLIGTDYSFAQLQARVGVSSAPRKPPRVIVDVGEYVEAGMSGVSVFNSNQRVASDWWLANGQMRNNLKDPTQASRAQEFASLRRFGYEFKGESLLPALKDNTAHVFMRVPNANVNFGNTTAGQSQDVIAIPPEAPQGEYITAPDGSLRQNPIGQGRDYRAQTEARGGENFIDWARRHLPLGTRDQYISVDNTAALMTQLASRSPQSIELAYVTPQQLARSNADKLHTIVDPTTGQQTQAFKVGDWIDTTLLQVEGRPGLYIDKQKLDPRLLNAQGEVQLEADLPHWPQHLSPQQQPSLTTPRVLQSKSEFADNAVATLTPTNRTGTSAYFDSTRAIADGINARAGRQIVRLARPDDAAVFPGRPFSAAPQPQHYRNAEQYVQDLRSYITSVRDVYREAERRGVMLTDPQTSERYSPRVHVDAAQQDLDYLDANRRRIVDAISTEAHLRQETGDAVRDDPLMPDNALPNDAYPLR